MIKINGKEYDNEKEFDFGGLAKLEECGCTYDDLQNLQEFEKPMALIIGLVAWVIDCKKRKAIEEINAHIKNGGTLNELMVLLDSLKESDFLKAMAKKM